MAKVPSNPVMIEWPSDRMGLTVGFKKEGMKLAGRVNGQRDKLDLSLAVLDILREHMIERFKAQVAIQAQTNEAAVLRQQQAEERAERDRQAALRKAQAQVERLEAAAPSGDEEDSKSEAE